MTTCLVKIIKTKELIIGETDLVTPTVLDINSKKVYIKEEVEIVDNYNTVTELPLEIEDK